MKRKTSIAHKPPATDTHPKLKSNISETIAGNNKFALEIYLKLSERKGNIFLSPWSISSAIAMTCEGARGKTADEMQSVMQFSKNDAIRRQSFALLYEEINAKDAVYTLKTANAIWVQRDYSLLSEYVEIIEKYYHGAAENVDFQGAAEKARQTINSWVEKSTEGKITDLIPKGFLDPLTALVLTNAVYFKGVWAREFDKSITRDEEFQMDDGSAKMVSMMRSLGPQSRFNFMETERMQMLEMLYQGENISMMILLPKGNIFSLEKALTMDKLTEWMKDLEEHQVEVFIPRFKFSTKYFLKDCLVEMGMPTAFTPNADFSGISGSKALFISHVIHQAFVDVNEEGTEAAASTGVVLSRGISLEEGPIPAFRADHPFIFLIKERKTGSILFFGRVSDPRDLNM
jgi:serpin B